MKKDRTCKYCDTTTENVHGREFANHVRWCDKNPNRRKGLDKIGNSTKDYWIREFGEFKKYIVSCENCNEQFEVEEREKKFPSKKYYCSRPCANSRGVRTEEFKRILREKYKKTRLCDYCEVEFSPITRSKFCSYICKKEKNKQRKIPKENSDSCDDYDKRTYKWYSSFKFSLNEYPEEFDFGLIEKNGWYSPSNSKVPNLGGVSRDHVVSVSYGYENNIDPEIISHPVNCQLMIHSENISKNNKCHMTIEELMLRIEEWNGKYMGH